MKKPEIIQDYNKFIRGLGRADQILLLPVLQDNLEIDKEVCVLFATHGCPKQFYIVKNNTPQTKIKRASAMLSRPSYLTVWKMTEPEEREDENDSADDGSLASTSTALPC